jgi:hypothetical protein
MIMPPGGGHLQMGLMALTAYLAIGVIAWLVDRGQADVADRLPAGAARA